MISPPCGLPIDGVTLVIVGAVLTGQRGSGGIQGATVLKVTSIVRVTLLTVAVTCATSARGSVRWIVAIPLVVVRISEVTAGLTSMNEPADVTNSTAVPFATGAPFSVTVAVIVTVESMIGVKFEAESVRVTLFGGWVPPPPLFPPPAGGAVGVSPLHAANSNRMPSSAIQDFRFLILNMLRTPVTSHTPTVNSVSS